METTINEFEPDTVGTLMEHLSKLPRDMPITDSLGEWATFRVVEDSITRERCLEVA